MRQVMVNMWRFVNRHPRIGGGLMVLSVVSLIGFCVYAWWQCAHSDELQKDMVTFLSVGFEALFLILAIAVAFSLVLTVSFLVSRQMDKVKESLRMIRFSVLIVAVSSIAVVPMALLVYEDLRSEATNQGGETCASAADLATAPYREVLKEVLPKNATDIYVNYSPGGFLGGGMLFVRCKVAAEDLRKYIKDHGYDFRYDSKQENANKNGNSEIAKTWPNADGKGFLEFVPDNMENWLNTHSDVKEYWSYNYIYTNNGGYRMFYDVKRQLFYYERTSN